MTCDHARVVAATLAYVVANYRGTVMTEERKTVDSASDDRTANNLMRHEYRVLGDVEKLHMQEIKDAGLEFVRLLHRVGGTLPDLVGTTGQALPERLASRELSLAQTKIEEAVFWAVKHVTR